MINCCIHLLVLNFQSYWLEHSLVICFVAALWTPWVLTLFNEVLFFSQQYEDNKPADLSCGRKSCQLTVNKLRILVAISPKNSGLAATKKEAFVGVVCLSTWSRRVGVSLKSLCCPWINTRLDSEALWYQFICEIVD